MKAANSGAMRGKTARACDSCLKKRARWFCAADDAFLCQACDSSVHSANQLASRHLRVRINDNNSSSVASTTSAAADEQCLPTPAWFTRKARTPRPNSNNKKFLNEEEKVLMNSTTHLQLLVPQMDEERNTHTNTNNNEEEEEEEEEQEDLLCRVPVFDLCGDMNNDGNLITGFLDSDANREDLLDFSADVESLLAAGEGDPDHQNHVKIKDEEQEEEDEAEELNYYFSPDFEESLMGWDFDYELPMIKEDDEEEEQKPAVMQAPANSIVETAGNLTMTMISTKETNKEEMRNVFLRLNHEAVMAAWATQGSPWTTGRRPELNPDDYWGHCMGTNMHFDQHGGVRGQMGCNDHDHSGREARVSRYREKKRARLFSKKIRYEVRKLNAEKRPRMKGRFVKRTTATSFVGTTSPTSN